MPTKFLLKPETVKITGLSSSTIFRMEKAGLFPNRRQISTRRVGWLESEVLEWMANREVVHDRRRKP